MRSPSPLACILTLLALAAALPAQAQPAEPRWTTLLGTSTIDEATDLVRAPDGTLYLTGFTLGSLAADNPGARFGGRPDDLLLARLAPDGTLAWSRQLGVRNTVINPGDQGLAITLTTTGLVVVAGRAGGDFDGDEGPLAYYGRGDVLVAAYTPEGTLAWVTHFGTDEEDQTQAVAPAPDGGVYVGGFSRGDLNGTGAPVGGFEAGFLAKLDASGTVVWTRRIRTDGSDQFLRQVRAIAVDEATGEIVVAGGGAYVARFDAAGTLLWLTQYASAFWYDLVVAGEGTAFVVGGTGTAAGEVVLARYDAAGTEVWTHVTDRLDWALPNGRHTGQALALSGNRLFVAGCTDVGTQVNLPQCRLLLGQVDAATGEPAWLESLGTDLGYDTDGRGLVVAQDGSLVVAGLATGPFGGEPHAGAQDVLVLRVPVEAGLVVNTTGDAADSAPGDGSCDTGGTVERNGTEEPACTLRAAIEEANAEADRDEITFDIPEADPGYGAGMWTIMPEEALPPVEHPVAIEGPTLEAVPGKQNGQPKPWPAVMLDGAYRGDGRVGLELRGARSTLRNLIIMRHTGPGVYVATSAQETTIEHCLIGTDADGRDDLGNRGSGVVIDNARRVQVGGLTAETRTVIAGNAGYGIEIKGDDQEGGNLVVGTLIGLTPDGQRALGNAAGGVHVRGLTHNTIGGASDPPGAAPGNVIAGHTDPDLFTAAGITLQSDANQVAGNLIGTDATGQQALGNDVGVVINDGAQHNVIGVIGSNAGVGNVISGNIFGVFLSGGGTEYTIVRRNRIGTDITGREPLGNGDGIVLDGGARTIIGGQGDGDGNLIAYNDGRGIAVQRGTGHALWGNRLWDNQGLGIDLGGDGVTLNDADDADEGANHLQNYPTLTSIHADGSTTTVRGFLASTPETTFRLEFFAVDQPDTTGFGEASAFLSALDVTTDSTGQIRFNHLLDGRHPRVVATATAPDSSTSELSKSPVMVISAGDEADLTSTDGVCDTGQTVGDQPACTLRAAITTANAILGPDYIAFAIEGEVPHVIRPTRALPRIVAALQIDATTQPGAAGVDYPIHLRGSSAGADVSGLHIDAGDVTIRGLWIHDFSRHGVMSVAPRLIVAGVHVSNHGEHGIFLPNGSLDAHPWPDDPTRPSTLALGNGRHGIAAPNGAIRIRGHAQANANGTGQTVEVCLSEGISGLYGAAGLDLETIEAQSNCGYGLRSGADLVVNGTVRVLDNDAHGVWALDEIILEGPSLYINDNGLRGIFSSNASVALRGGGPNSDPTIADVQLVDNGDEGIAAQGDVEVRGYALVQRNGFNDPISVCEDQKKSGIRTRRGRIRTGRVDAKDNCGDGLQGEGIEIQGDATITGNSAIGLWSVDNLTLDGSTHDISDNGLQGIFTPNGTVTIAGAARVSNNGSEQPPEACRDPVMAGLRADGRVQTDDLEASNNCGSGLFSPARIDIRGNATVIGNTARGILTFQDITLAGSRHDLSDNAEAGASTTGGSIRLTGHARVANNNTRFRDTDPGKCTPDGRFTAALIAPHVVDAERLEATDNCGVGVSAAQRVQVAHADVTRNTAHGLVSRSMRVAAGSVSFNGGAGLWVRGGRLRLGTVRIEGNTGGGIVGATEGTAGKAPQAPSLLAGTAILANEGDGIHLSDGRPMLITQSIIAGNTGLGVSTAGPVIEADQVWWGDASGPGGQGSGSGDGVSAGVVFAPWRTAPVSLTAAASLDTLYIQPGSADSILVFVRDWQATETTIDVTLSDEQGWVDGATSAEITLGGDAPVPVSVPVAVPGTRGADEASWLRVTATGRTDPSITATDSFLVRTYQPTLVRLQVAPDTLNLLPGESQVFTATGLDQTSTPIPVAPVWSATGGTIDAEGRYTAGDAIGVFAVTATDPASALQDQAVVHIVNTGTANEEPEALPSTFALHANYPNPFNPMTTIPFDVKEPAHVSLRVYDMLGRQVATLVDRPYAPGRYTAQFEAGTLPSGMYFYAIEMGAFRAVRSMVLVQ